MDDFFEQLPAVDEWRNVDISMFKNELLPAGKPAVLRGLASHWPAVDAGHSSAEALLNYLKAMKPSGSVELFLADSDTNGNMFYTHDLRDYNFKSSKVSFEHAIDCIYGYQKPDSPVAYAGSVPVAQHMPTFMEENSLGLFDNQITPRIWLGNKVKVAAHYDLSHNMACAVRGRRRFRLFPPQQVENLYVGPIDYTLGGRPASLVKFDEPDFYQFPRFKDALASASVAELEPGDALYIPSMWWHHVESLDSFSVLANYWWSPSMLGGDSAYDAMLHSLLTISALPKHERAAWRAFFDHYVFRSEQDPAKHIPEHRRGVLGEMTPKLYEYIKGYLINSMKLGWRKEDHNDE